MATLISVFYKCFSIVTSSKYHIFFSKETIVNKFCWSVMKLVWVVSRRKISANFKDRHAFITGNIKTQYSRIKKMKSWQHVSRIKWRHDAHYDNALWTCILGTISSSRSPSLKCSIPATKMVRNNDKLITQTGDCFAIRCEKNWFKTYFQLTFNNIIFSVLNTQHFLFKNNGIGNDENVTEFVMNLSPNRVYEKRELDVIPLIPRREGMSCIILCRRNISLSE